MNDLEPVFRRVNEAHLGATLAPGTTGYEGRLAFALERLREGRKAHSYLAGRYPDVVAPGARVLDVGCGNGGLLLPFAEAGLSCWGLDVTLHPELAETAGAAGVPLRQVQGRGEALPFPDGVFDLVLLAETLEHVAAPRAVGREVARVLRPGGLCYLTTPPRLRYLLGRDPHYDVPGLLLLPDGLQRLLFERVLAPGEPYAVVHTFWTAAGVLRCLPGLRTAEITSRNWAGPLRRLDWDWIVGRREHDGNEVAT
ncbi:MAG: class I SAM-dependent methyltransferase [Thermoanaerobaculia bacterium]